MQHLSSGESLVPGTCAILLCFEGIVVLLDASCRDADVVDHMQQIGIHDGV